MGKLYLLALLGFLSLSCTTVNTQISQVSTESAASSHAFEMSDPKTFLIHRRYTKSTRSHRENSGDEPRPEDRGAEGLLS